MITRTRRITIICIHRDHRAKRESGGGSPGKIWPPDAPVDLQASLAGPSWQQSRQVPESGPRGP